MFNGSAYKTLGLKEGASAEEIKTAYRRLAMKHHPDRGGDPEEFKKIQSAYDYLNSVGDHVQLRKRARPDNSNFNYSFFNQAEMAEIFKNLRENLSSLVIEIPEISWYDAIHGTDKIKQGVPPGGSFINGDKIVKVKKINLKSGLSFRNKFVSTHHGFGAVCIEYTHTEIRFFGYSNQYQTVCTDTGMISAPFSGGFYRILQRRRQGIYIDIIIAGSLHLGELDSCCHFD
jgi:curved DNA-binding protein CbpA